MNWLVVDIHGWAVSSHRYWFGAWFIAVTRGNAYVVRR